MLQLSVTVRPEHVERALDQLLVAYPDGVHVREEESGVLLTVARDELGDVAGALAHVEDLLLTDPQVREVPDDWRERRQQRFVPRRYGDRLAVRPPWAAPAEPAWLDVVIDDEGGAFGSGEHPTTRACLELLCRIDPEDSLADLGCGSGVLAVAAALLGWPTVYAVDLDPRSVRAAAENAGRNGVEVSTSALDLMVDAPPAATLTLANVPADVHTSLAGRLASRTVVATGIEADRLDEVTAAYTRAGYRSVVAEEMVGWALLVLERS